MTDFRLPNEPRSVLPRALARWSGCAGARTGAVALACARVVADTGTALHRDVDWLSPNFAIDACEVLRLRDGESTVIVGCCLGVHTNLLLVWNERFDYHHDSHRYLITAPHFVKTGGPHLPERPGKGKGGFLG